MEKTQLSFGDTEIKLREELLEYIRVKNPAYSNIAFTEWNISEILELKQRLDKIEDLRILRQFIICPLVRSRR